MLKTIRAGDTGYLVCIAQYLTGYVKSGESDGQYTQEFAAYIMNWQHNHGLASDGIIGPNTWTKIAETAPTCSTSKNKNSQYTRAVQLLLGGANLTADGVYGTKTKNAVAAFQASAGLNADGICGPKTWKALIEGTESKPVTPDVTPGKFVQPVDYKQGDSRWGKKNYTSCGNKKQTMANSGCGPTAMADIIATWYGKENTPWTLAQLAMKWGDRTKSSGTATSFFKHVQQHFGIKKMVSSTGLAAVKACLDNGGYVVCRMGPGYWTKGGHYICAWKYDDTYIYCNDPASSTRKKQKLTQFMKERKDFFCFYPNGGTDHPFDKAVWSGDDEIKINPVDPEVPEIEVDLPYERGEKICDISKYQPTINYDAFIEDTALIILRAGYRGTGGSIKEDQKFQLHANNLTERGIRFGVYFYSIATDEEKAKEEARMFWQYAKGYKPLFWAMDAEKNTMTKAAIVAFVEELRRLGAEKVGCYCANHLYQKFDYGSIRDKFDFTWIPRYSSNPPVYPCDMWQYTSTGKVNGISGDVDLNKITGQGHDLKWFTE